MIIYAGSLLNHIYCIINAVNELSLPKVIGQLEGQSSNTFPPFTRVKASVLSVYP